jgi:hypothetical protein
MTGTDVNGQGARTWFFPDGYIPAESKEGSLPSHEALMLLNTGSLPARAELDVYFEDRDPVKGIPIEVGAERVVMIRMDNPGQLGGLAIPRLTQYALRVRSDRKVIAQFGRLDATQPNLAYYCTIGYAED